MKQVCVLGNGQLGRMLRQAGEPLGISVWPVGLDAEPTAVPVQHSVITAEIERWPETALTRELARHPAFVNRDVFPIIADRLTQKQLFDKLGLATAPWELLSDKGQWSGLFDKLGELAIVKRRVGGYDGRGQWRLRADETGELPDDCYGECIVERGIHFSGEVSLVGARARWQHRLLPADAQFASGRHLADQRRFPTGGRRAAGAGGINAVSNYAGAELRRRDGDGVFYHAGRSVNQRAGAARA